MADHLTDEEQLQTLKNWWKENGNSLLTAVLFGLIAYFGFQWWQSTQKQQAEQASALYGELLETLQVTNNEALSEEKQATANYLIKQLQDEYSGTQYAVNGALFAAKLAVDKQDLEAAESALLWAADNADEGLQYVVNLRLARVYLAQKKYDESLALVSDDPAEEFSSLYAEIRGDIFVAKNNSQEARKAYQQALDALGDAQGIRRQLLPIKIANLSSGEK